MSINYKKDNFFNHSTLFSFIVTRENLRGEMESANLHWIAKILKEKKNRHFVFRNKSMAKHFQFISSGE